MATPQGDSYGCASGGVIAAGRQHLSPFWRDLPSGWTELTVSGTKPSPGILAYSGMALDPTGGAIYLFGGGHYDYWGNDVWQIDLESLSYTRLYAPDFDGMNPAYGGTVESDTTLNYAQTVVSGSYPGALVISSIPKRPISRHTYNSVCWIDSIGKMYAGGGSTWSGVGERYWHDPGVWHNSPRDTWVFTPSGFADGWEYKGSALTDAAILTASSINIYHRTLDKLFQVDKDGNSRLVVRSWNPHTNAWAQFSSNSAVQAIGWVAAADTKRNRLLITSHLPPNPVYLLAFYPQSNTWETLSSGELTAIDGLTYDEQNDCALVLTTSGMSVYDCAADTISNSSVPMPNLAQVNGRFVYDRKRNASILVYSDSGNVRCFAYRK